MSQTIGIKFKVCYEFGETHILIGEALAVIINLQEENYKLYFVLLDTQC